MNTRPELPSLGNGHLGVVDSGDATAALLCARLQRRGHLLTRLLAGTARPQRHDAGVAGQVVSWSGGRLPTGLDALVATGGRRDLDLVLHADPAVPRLIARSCVDLIDEMAVLTWLADHDVDVPRMLGGATDPRDLSDALPTHGPVVLAHSAGTGAFVRRRCAGRRELDEAVRAAQDRRVSNPNLSGLWYLSEDLGVGEAVVAGVYRGGEPLVWGARSVVRDRFGRPVRIGPASSPGRLFELAEDAAGQLRLDGPAEIQFAVTGHEAAVIGVAPVVTWSLLDLGSAADDAIAAALAALGVPCASRPPSTPDTAVPSRWRAVAPHRAWTTSGSLARRSNALVDPWLSGPNVPMPYRRWASAAGRHRDPLVSVSERTASPRPDR